MYSSKMAVLEYLTEKQGQSKKKKNSIFTWTVTLQYD